MIFLFVTSLPPIITIFSLVVLCIEIDPFFVYTIIVKEEIKSTLVLYLIQSIRLISFAVFAQWVFVGIKCGTIIVLTTSVSSQNVLKIVRKQKLCYSGILMYKQFVVTSNILRPFQEVVASLGFFVIFVFLVISTVGAFIAWKLDKLVVLSLMLVLGGVTLVLLLITFDVCCSIYETSVNIRSKWAANLKIVPKFFRLFLRKLIASCRIVTIPAGFVGIIDKEIKMHYLNVTVDTIVDLLIFMLEIVL